ncbi:unnamed protein product [Mycena citricolor]|uniref:Mitochondrial outer membrane transport complex Sam37/metaxin N-terminal domain-containing protein n=1 Tax=Mycena citricolor TaxID=2018698 RepID=A0AAD2Q1A7_9AGAR|nr:unnamed protein product [Mycena citricolor]
MSQPVLHIWPAHFGLISSDPSCLAAALLLQLTIPGKFAIEYCTNPDLSPSGSLPYLSHENTYISSLPSIISYLTLLEGGNFKAVDVDAGLSAIENSKRIAWCSHVESNLGTLVAYVLYSATSNWTQLTHRTLASTLPVPQRYYVPIRMRNMTRPRLEAAGLWSEQSAEASSSPMRSIGLPKEALAEKFAQTIQRDKATQMAKDCLDTYVRLLGTNAYNEYFIRNRLTLLDVQFAAYILILLKPPFPEPVISDLLRTSYPSLVAHAERLLELSQASPPPPVKASSITQSLVSLLPRPLWKATPPQSPEDILQERLTWGWISMAVGSVALFIMTQGIPLREIPN